MCPELLQNFITLDLKTNPPLVSQENIKELGRRMPISADTLGYFPGTPSLLTPKEREREDQDKKSPLYLS